MKKHVLSILPQQLRRARQAAGYTQAELAEKVELAVEAYGRLERGKVLPRTETLAKVAMTLGVSVDTLLGISPVPSTDQQRSPELERLLHRLLKQSPASLRALDGLLATLSGEEAPKVVG